MRLARVKANAVSGSIALTNRSNLTTPCTISFAFGERPRALASRADQETTPSLFRCLASAPVPQPFSTRIPIIRTFSPPGVPSRALTVHHTLYTGKPSHSCTHWCRWTDRDRGTQDTSTIGTIEERQLEPSQVQITSSGQKEGASRTETEPLRTQSSEKLTRRHVTTESFQSLVVVLVCGSSVNRRVPDIRERHW